MTSTPHTNVPIEGHPLLGKRLTFRADLPPYDPATDTEGGTTIVAPGMTVIVRAVFRHWNGVAGLDMLYVGCEETGYSTHVVPADLGLPPLDQPGATRSTEPKPTPAEVKEYVFEPRATYRDGRYDGQRIARLEPLPEDAYDRDEVGPMFVAHLASGVSIHVFEDEVQDRTGQIAQERVLAGEPTSPDPYAHPLDCLFCNAGEPMNHLYEPPTKD